MDEIDEKFKVFKNHYKNKDNTSLMMMFRCTKKKYAEELKEGKIFFNKPINWIREEQNTSNKGRGDLLEGSFISLYENEKNKPEINSLLEKNSLDYVKKDNYYFFRRKEIDNLFCLCFYGLKRNSFIHKKVDRLGRAHYYSIVDNQYFTDFSDGISKQDYENIDEDERPQVIFINNPNIFLNRIVNQLKKMGLKDDEIIIDSVIYENKFKDQYLLMPFPYEYFFKDDFFSKQSEIRIIIYSKNEDFNKIMEENNGILDIGNLSECTEIYDYYFEDLEIEFSRENEIIFNAPKSEFIPFEKMDLNELLSLYVQIISDRLPFDMTEEDKKSCMDCIDDILLRKFDLTVLRGEKNISLYNPSEVAKKELDKIIEHPDEDIESTKKLIEDLILKNKIDEALNKINENNLKLSDNRIIFYHALILKRQGKYDEAILKYKICIDNSYEILKSLDGLTDCYLSINKNELAIESLNMIQDLLGYNVEIYNKKAFAYIQLENYDEALLQLDKAIEIDYNSAEAHFNKGFVYYKLNKFSLAKKEVIIAIKLDPNNQNYKQQFVEFYEKL